MVAYGASKGLRGERLRSSSHSMGGSNGGTCEYGFGMSVRSLTSGLGAGGGAMEIGRLKSPEAALPVPYSSSTSAMSASSGHRTGREGAPLVLTLSGSSIAPTRQFGEVRKCGEKDGEETGGTDGDAISSVGNGVGSLWLDRRQCCINYF